MYCGRSREPQDLRLEPRTDPRVLAASMLWMLACMAATWQADLPVPLIILASVALLVLALPVVASQRFGARGRRPAALNWRANGWDCEFADGAREELELSPESRVFPGGALLLYRYPRGVAGWLLVLQRREPRDPVRRLRVRLELDRAHAAPCGR